MQGGRQEDLITARDTRRAIPLKALHFLLIPQITHLNLNPQEQTLRSVPEQSQYNKNKINSPREVTTAELNTKP